MQSLIARRAGRQVRRQHQWPLVARIPGIPGAGRIAAGRIGQRLRGGLEPHVDDGAPLGDLPAAAAALETIDVTAAAQHHGLTLAPIEHEHHVGIRESPIVLQLAEMRGDVVGVGARLALVQRVHPGCEFRHATVERAVHVPGVGVIDAGNQRRVVTIHRVCVVRDAFLDLLPVPQPVQQDFRQVVHALSRALVRIRTFVSIMAYLSRRMYRCRVRCSPP
jgi:hypothetical protein